MNLLYNFSIRLYTFLIPIASLFSKKAKLWVQGRKDIFSGLSSAVKPGDKIVWFHCASLGEFEQGRPVMEWIKKNHAGYKILLTFFSPSGYEVRKNYGGADYTFYLPADIPSNVQRFLSIISPVLAVFVKYEFWFNYIQGLHDRKIPLFLISGILRPGQYFFKSYGSWFRKKLGCFEYFFVQDEQSLELLKSAGISNVIISGDTRFDRVSEASKSSFANAIAESFKQNKMLVIAGSTWPEDESLLVRCINEDTRKLKWILAPHEISRSHIEKLIGKISKKSVCYSSADSLKEAEVLIIDNVGMLASLYCYAELAYVGGGFGRGIHNILEPAAFGVPVVFGPHYEKFREAVELISLNGAFAVNNYEGLKKITDCLLSDDARRKKAGDTCRSYVEENTGATRVIAEKLAGQL